MKTEYILMAVTGVILVGGVVLYVKSKQVQTTTNIPTTGGSTNPVITKPVFNNPILKQPLVTQTTTPVITNPVLKQPVITSPVITSPLTTTEQIFQREGKLSLLDEYKGTMYGVGSNLLR